MTSRRRPRARPVPGRCPALARGRPCCGRGPSRTRWRHRSGKPTATSVPSLPGVSAKTCQLVCRRGHSPRPPRAPQSPPPRGQQRGDLRQRADQGALGHLQAVGGQGGDDPVQRAAEHVLLVRQAGQEHSRSTGPSGSPSAAGPRTPSSPRQFRRALAAPPVPAPPPQDPPQQHLPVHLLRVLGAQVLVLGAAAAAPPQLRSTSMNRSSVSRCACSWRP